MDEPPELHGDRVTLRPLVEADVQPLLEIMQQPGVRDWWVEYDEGQLRGEMFDEPSVSAFSVRLGGELIGVVMATEELNPFYKMASLDIAIADRRQGQGLGTETLRTVIRFLFEQRGHHHILIDPAVINEQAIAAYRKVGFRPVGVLRQNELGRDGAWRDTLLMDLVTGELT